MTNSLPLILDTTLRDGEQTPGVVFSLDDKLALAVLLDKAGIQEVEIGSPAMGNTEIADMREITGRGFGFKTLSWCRALKSDVDLAVKTGTDGIHISFPVSAIHLQSMGKSEKWVIRSLHELIPYANEKFEYVTVGMQDASRTDLRFLKECIHALLKYRVKRVRIADTVGILNPFSTFDMINNLHHDFSSAALEFHGHNDLGMATANSLAAYKGGADCINTTVNGLGERAGNTAMDEFVMAMQHSFGIRLPIRTELFNELASSAANASGIPVPVNKPVTGPGVFYHETGIHTNLLLKNRETYQIIPAASIGRKEDEFVFGKHSGVNAFRALLEKHNLYLPDNRCKELVNLIKIEAVRLKRSLTASELLAIVER
jgi:homocitrate synthase NifV